MAAAAPVKRARGPRKTLHGFRLELSPSDIANFLATKPMKERLEDARFITFIPFQPGEPGAWVYDVYVEYLHDHEYSYRPWQHLPVPTEAELHQRQLSTPDTIVVPLRESASDNVFSLPTAQELRDQLRSCELKMQMLAAQLKRLEASRLSGETWLHRDGGMGGGYRIMTPDRARARAPTKPVPGAHYLIQPSWEQLHRMLATFPRDADRVQCICDNEAGWRDLVEVWGVAPSAVTLWNGSIETWPSLSQPYFICILSTPATVGFLGGLERATAFLWVDRIEGVHTSTEVVRQFMLQAQTTNYLRQRRAWEASRTSVGGGGAGEAEQPSVTHPDPHQDPEPHQESDPHQEPHQEPESHQELHQDPDPHQELHQDPDPHQELHQELPLDAPHWWDEA